jgi:hypothetical protein
MLTPQKRPPMFTMPFLVLYRNDLLVFQNISRYFERPPGGAKKTVEAAKGLKVTWDELQDEYKREC